jgi:tetratricopeptide (TPR) repeat protein
MFSTLKKMAAPGALALLLLSCQSIGKDIRLDTQEEVKLGNLAELEQAIVTLDGSGSGGGSARDRIGAARRRIAELEKAPSADTAYSAALAAWSGRLYILEGKTAEAARQLKNSQSLSPGNIQSLILSFRLEGDPQKRLALIDREIQIEGTAGGTALLPEAASSPAALLQIERGRVLLELRRYGEAAGAFDTAFAGGLAPVYRETYTESRSLAWELRNALPGTEDKTMELLERGGIRWIDLIELAKTETDLLRFLTAGRDVPQVELFNRLLERSFIPYTQDITLDEWPAAKPQMEAAVFRSGAAWFLWRLYAEGRADRGLLSRYSSRYSRMTSPQSPIADLPLLSPFFDSILGVVESELMFLPDGRNFHPAEPVRGAEMLTMLRKVTN